MMMNHEPLVADAFERFVASTLAAARPDCWLVMLSTQITQAMSPATWIVTSDNSNCMEKVLLKISTQEFAHFWPV